MLKICENCGIKADQYFMYLIFLKKLLYWEGADKGLKIHINFLTFTKIHFGKVSIRKLDH